MLTRERYNLLIAMAGAQFLWGGQYARPASNLRPGLYAFLKEYAKSFCVFCEAYDDNGEICHIVSGTSTVNSEGRQRRGYIQGNIGYGCRMCNEIQAIDGRIVDYDSIARPDLIPVIWPDNAALKTRTERLQWEKAQAIRAHRELLAEQRREREAQTLGMG